MSSPATTILLVDDSYDAFMLMKSVLTAIRDQKYQLQWVSSYDAGLELIGRETFDACLIDYHLDKLNGIHLIEQMIAQGCTAPMILITGHGDREVDLAAMKAGAVDYLDKTEINYRNVDRTLRYAIENARVTRALRESEKALEQERLLLRTVIDHIPDYIYAKDTQRHYILSNRAHTEVVRSTPEDIIGKTDEIFVPPELAAEFRASDQAVLEAGKTLPKYETRSVDKDGQPTWELTTKAPLRDLEGQIIGIVGISRDISEVKRSEMLEQEQRALAEALRDTAEALNSSLDFEDILDCILSSAERIVPHDNACILMIEGENARIVRPRDYREGDSPQALNELRFVVAETANLRDMVSSKEALIIPDVTRDPEWKHLVDPPWVYSYIGMPLQIAGDVIGFLSLVSHTPNAFSPHLLGRLQAFSSQISIALQNARLYQQAQELAALKERHWLANELHDAVSQSLFAIRLVAGGLPHMAHDLPTDVRESLKELDQLSHRAHSEMRSLLLELRPAALEQTPLHDLLSQLIETFQSRNKGRVTAQLAEGIILPADAQITLYRIAQEALNNIVKHAHAQEVTLLLQRRDGVIDLTIRDNGRGFDLASLPPNHFGVGIMRERAAAVGAGLEILSQPGQGTSIAVTWPAPDKA